MLPLFFFSFFGACNGGHGSHLRGKVSYVSGTCQDRKGQGSSNGGWASPTTSKCRVLQEADMLKEVGCVRKEKEAGDAEGAVDTPVQPECGAWGGESL